MGRLFPVSVKGSGRMAFCHCHTAAMGFVFDHVLDKDGCRGGVACGMSLALTAGRQM
jgi:hypothetical protein